MHGRNNDFTMQHLAGKALSARQVDEYVEEKETIYRRLCREDPARFHLALGAEELLDAPDFYLRAAETLGLEPKNCIVFEDAVSGLRAAAAAGAGKVIAVAPEERREAFERMPEVYEVIPNFHEFDRLLLRE